MLTKTVGLDPGVCAATDQITVTRGTEVTYCYQVENTGDITLTLHDLADSELGALLTGYSYDLLPGASVFVTQSAAITQTTANTAAWTAYNTGPVDVAVYTDTATVRVAPGGPGQVVGKAWFDLDGSGTQNNGEPGLPGVKVTLSTGAGTVVSTTMTSAGGGYSFAGLAVSQGYTATVTPLPGYYGTTPTSLNTYLTLVTPMSSALDFGLQQGLIYKRLWQNYFCPGWSQRYDIEIHNTTGITLTNVVVTDTLPAALRFSDTSFPDGTSTHGTYVSASHEVVWKIATLPVDGIARLHLHVYILSTTAEGTSVENLARLVSDQVAVPDVGITFVVNCPLPATPTATLTRTPTRTISPTATGTLVSTPTPTRRQRICYSDAHGDPAFDHHVDSYP